MLRERGRIDKDRVRGSDGDIESELLTSRDGNLEDKNFKNFLRQKLNFFKEIKEWKLLIYLKNSKIQKITFAIKILFICNQGADDHCGGN